jgi:hypothetical protein
MTWAEYKMIADVLKRNGIIYSTHQDFIVDLTNAFYMHDDKFKTYDFLRYLEPSLKEQEAK